MPTDVADIPVSTGTKRTERAPRRGNPWSPLDELRAEMERFWDRPFYPTLPRFGMRTEGWLPTTDVFEQDGTLYVRADLPGMKKGDVEVSVIEGDLILEGERKEVGEENKDYYRSECLYGHFYRRLPLPAGIDASNVKAELCDGVLEVTMSIPEAPEQRKKRIRVA